MDIELIDNLLMEDIFPHFKNHLNNIRCRGYFNRKVEYNTFNGEWIERDVLIIDVILNYVFPGIDYFTFTNEVGDLMKMLGIIDWGFSYKY